MLNYEVNYVIVLFMIIISSDFLLLSDKKHLTVTIVNVFIDDQKVKRRTAMSCLWNWGQPLHHSDLSQDHLVGGWW